MVETEAEADVETGAEADVGTGAEADDAAEGERILREPRAKADVETEAEREADPEAAKRRQLAAIAEASRAEAAGVHDAEVDEASPRADRALPSVDPEIEAERRSDQELRARFAREPVDRAWAPAAERFGAGLLARIPDLRDATIRCRSTMCEIRPSIHAERAEELVDDLIRARDAHLVFGGLRNTGEEHPDDDTYEPVWYLRRAAAPASSPGP